MKDIQNFNLLPFNTFGIEAHCKRFVEYADADEARAVAAILRESGAPYLLVGQGSNLLLTGDYDGIVVHSALKGIVRQGTKLTCGSGETWDDVVAFCVENGLCGAENLSLIPGEVGASAVQNIGAYGAEVKDLIASVECVEIETGRLCTFSNAECRYGYRYSRFKHDWKNRYLITRVTYQLQEVTPSTRLNTSYGNIQEELARRGLTLPTPAMLRQVVIDIRRAKLPDTQVTGNAGSFFMNPVVSKRKFEQLLTEYPQMPHYHIDDDHEKVPAGWLIDQCGWKGKSMGRAGVHDKQALVLVNNGGASGRDIVALCEAIQRDVKNRFGIDIKPEVNIV